jgi:allantoinase
MSHDLFLKNGTIVTEAGEFRGGIVIENGKIVELVGENVEVDARQVIDLAGKTVLPGLVDGHAHFNEPGREHWEGYQTGTMAAAAGGVTTVLEMPLNSTPPTTNRERLAEKRRVVEQKAFIDYAQWGGFVDNNLPDLEGMHQDGVIGFKAFASNSGVDFARINDDLLFAGLEETKRLGNLIGLHAENEWLTTYLGNQLRASGRIDRASWCESRPPITEVETIERACTWAHATGGNLHIVHVSTADGIRAVAKARHLGDHVTVETCPHYLFFNQDDFEKIGPAAKCAPPIRTHAEVEALWQVVLEGLVDTIGSDHSPCNWEEKEKGMENIWKAWGGISGIQSMLPVLLSEGVNKRGMNLSQLVKLTSANPARLFGIYPQKGTLMPGSDADIVVVDLNKEWTLTTDNLFYKNKHSAYVGRTFKGKVDRTIVRGETIYQDDRIVAKPGFGKLLRRSHSYNY